MPFELTKNDQDLLSISVLRVACGSTDPVSGFTGDTDSVMQFQFPPIIKTDTKSAKWPLLYNVPGYEPQYMYAGAEPRKMSFTTTYVVGGPSGGQGGGNWTTKKCQREVNNWKAYFYMQNVGAGDTLPVFYIKMWEYLPQGAGSFSSAWRGMSYNIKHGDTKIKDSEGIFHLITEVSMDLQLVTQIAADDNEMREPYKNLDPKPAQEWY